MLQAAEQDIDIALARELLADARRADEIAGPDGMTKMALGILPSTPAPTTFFIEGTDAAGLLRVATAICRARGQPPGRAASPRHHPLHQPAPPLWPVGPARECGLGSVSAGHRPHHLARRALRWTGQFHAQCGSDYSPLQPFGCFSYEPPGPGGVVRIHFTPPATAPNDGDGPLSRAQMGHRRAELAAMVRHVRQHHQGATSVMGVSWLYNLPAYCRLFPADYAASAQLPSFALHLNGSSTWGQVVDHRQQVKPHLRDQLLANLPALDVAAPWRVFPLPALVASAPLACFF